MDKFTKKDKICAPHKNDKSKTCFSREALLKIAKSLGLIKTLKSKKRTKTLWNDIRKKLSNKCNNDETCWVEKVDKIKKLRDPEIDLFTFKPKWPKEWNKNRHEWLDTYNIFNVMIQAEKVHKEFNFFGPVPADCPTSINCELSNLDPEKLMKKNIKKIGIVYNLDVSTGPGTHWTAVYIDIPKAELDYFDSYGSKPTHLINKFMLKLADKFQKRNKKPTLIFNDKRHQFGGSECGMYSMYFILKRLSGDNMYNIAKKKITDNDMNKLRNIFYRK